MPKSKRDKKVSLTQTKKKGLEQKKKLVVEIQECIDKFKRIFIISVQNMRNSKLRQVRQEWAHSRFFFGKNKVMALALGRTREDEYKMNLHKISRRLRGQTGLLFTDTSEDDVTKWFNEYSEEDFARSGNIAIQTIVVDAGPLPTFSHSMEPSLRQLGLPTALEKGVVTLLKSHTVCTKGSVLTPEQARILKLFGHKMATFRITIEATWSGEKYKAITAEKQDDVKDVSVKITPKATTEKDDDEAEMESDEADDDDAADDDDDDENS